ncbi:TPA: metallohydrolase [Vibrio vulnificus]|nr:metallohydrolase [Vibrio vulnificus]HDY8167817.1 metallohydrolase [Vibrio vulnificus]
MVAKITFFPVGNGDMTLIETESNKKILIDCRIRKGNDFPDVLTMLRNKLDRDSNKRLYIDLFVWSHPDEDHCQGIQDHFHLGTPENWNAAKDLIFINEIWSSPLVYRRASKTHKLCEDAKALNKEVKRRVNKFKEDKEMFSGNYVYILGQDEGDKTKDIPEIVLELDATIKKINGKQASDFSAKLLGPTPKSDLDENEEKLGKNHSSVIFNYEVKGEEVVANFLSAGDAEVVCWEALLDRLDAQGNRKALEYDILQAPHHCSWHSLSHDSLSEKGNNAEVSDKAVEAIGNAKNKAFIISSSNSIKDDQNDPPAYRAKNEYENILDNVSGSFKCVDDHKKSGKNIPLVIEINGNGLKLIPATSFTQNNNAPDNAVNRNGGKGYA